MTGPGFALRPAGALDLPGLTELSVRVIGADLARVLRFDPVRRAERMRAILAEGGLACVVSEGRVAGCIQACPRADHLALSSVFLEPWAQGRGLGRAVVEHVLAAHPGLPARIEVLLGSRARGFWERRGFRETGVNAIEWTMERPPG